MYWSRAFRFPALHHSAIANLPIVEKSAVEFVHPGRSQEVESTAEFRSQNDGTAAGVGHIEELCTAFNEPLKHSRGIAQRIGTHIILSSKLCEVGGRCRSHVVPPIMCVVYRVVGQNAQHSLQFRPETNSTAVGYSGRACRCKQTHSRYLS